jgi:hypothetical protein
MKNILLLTALLASQAAPAQQHLVSKDLGPYYDWFHARSQTEKLYTNQSTLYIFSNDAGLHQGPCKTSEKIHQLSQGEQVYNIAYTDEYYLPEDEINGYHDIWYHVTASDKNGKSVSGYVWGGDIAKGWRTIDISGDGKAEFLMLGVSSKERKELKDINAEIRILSDGELIALKTVPGLCVFEECDASALLRVYRTQQGFTIVETSTLTMGCWAGLEKAFHYWDGKYLQRVYHAEYLTATEFTNESFVVNYSSGTQLCQYSHEGSNFTPLWSCKKIETDNSRASIDYDCEEGAHALVAR